MSNNSEVTVEIIRAQLLEFIAETFVVDKEEVDLDVSLVQTGIIDSIGLIEITEYIESTWSMSVTENELIREHFGSVNKMVAYVYRKMTEK